MTYGNCSLREPRKAAARMNARLEPSASPNALAGWRDKGLRAIYGLILVLIAVFLYRLGPEPWLLAIGNWPVLVAVVLTTGAGLIVQAQSFRAVLPKRTPSLSLWRASNIWAIAAISSVVAPLFAGMATRTVLLVREGMSFGDCLVASARQYWLGIEFSLLAGAICMPLTILPHAKGLALGLGLGWAVLVLVRQLSGRREHAEEPEGRGLHQLLHALRGKIPSEAYLWFALQPLLMGATYYIGFNGMDANLSASEAMVLASLTVTLSVIIFVPNGLGITDAIWVLVASRAGLTLEESVAIALILRISHFLSSTILYMCTKVRSEAIQSH